MLFDGGVMLVISRASMTYDSHVLKDKKILHALILQPGSATDVDIHFFSFFCTICRSC